MFFFPSGKSSSFFLKYEFFRLITLSTEGVVLNLMSLLKFQYLDARFEESLFVLKGKHRSCLFRNSLSKLSSFFIQKARSFIVAQQKLFDKVANNKLISRVNINDLSTCVKANRFVLFNIRKSGIMLIAKQDLLQNF